jgi:protein-histidine N-methyltransferase
MFSFNFYDDNDDPVDKPSEEAKQDLSETRSIPLEQVLSQLPETLAYSLLNGLPRRELWHVKMQIMQQDQDTFLLGDSDVTNGSYEGGLKTWECSIDLAQYLSSQTYPHELSVLEVSLALVLRVDDSLGVARLYLLLNYFNKR